MVTPAKLRERKVGRARLQFIQRSATAERPRQQHNVPTGRIWVAIPEVTVFDLVESPEEGGGLSNVATVIGALLEEQRLGAAALASVAAIYPEVVAQRVGYLIDLMATEVGAEFDTEKTQEPPEGRPLPKAVPQRRRRRSRRTLARDRQR